jgi:hypothetical protein
MGPLRHDSASARRLLAFLSLAALGAAVGFAPPLGGEGRPLASVVGALADGPVSSSCVVDCLCGLSVFMKRCPRLLLMPVAATK